MGLNSGDTALEQTSEIVQDGVFHPELHHFRKDIESSQDSLKYQPYTLGKKKIASYKFTFIALGIFFSALSLFIFIKNPNWTYNYLILDGSVAFKSMIDFICLVFASLSFFLAFHRKVEVEIAHQIHHAARGRLKSIRRRKAANHDWKNYSGIREHYLASIPLKHAYQEILDKIDHKRDEVLLLLKQVAHTSFEQGNKKEMLFNQALVEYKLSLDNIIASFK